MPKKSSGLGKGRKNSPAKSSKLSGKKASVKLSRPKRQASKKPHSLGVHASENRLKLALEATQMTVWEWNLKTNVIEWSDNAHQLFGLTSSNFDGTFETYVNLVHPDDREAVLINIRRAIATKSSCHNENRIIWPDGSIHWLESKGKISIDAKGNAAFMVGTIQLITQRKAVEFDRENWKTRHELVSKSAGLVIYDYDLPTGNIIWSGNSKDVLGYKPEELGNIDRWIALIHSDDRKKAFDLLEVAENELKPYDVYYRFLKKNGEYCHIHDRGFFILSHGKPARMLGMMTDVSDRIKADQTIRESIRFRQSIESAMPDSLYVYDINNKQNIYTNRSIFGELGYTRDELHAMGNNFVSHIIHPDDIPKLRQWTNESAGFVHEIELRLKLKHGEYRWVSVRDTPFQWDKEGRVTHIVGIAQDITQKKATQEQLRQSEQSYRELFETVGEAIYILEPDGTIVDVNRGGCNMSGYEKSELISKSVTLLADEHQNPSSVKTWLAFPNELKSQSLEFLGRKKNGTNFLLEIRLTKGYYFGKDVIIASGWDITQRRQTENALRDSEQRFRTLQQASFGGIGLHDRGVIIDCNQGLCDITGYTYQELVGINGLELIAPEWRAFVMEKIVSSHDKPYDVEGIRKDGSRYILEIHGKNIPYEGRSIRVTEFRDVTERKRAEEKILEQNTRLLAVTEDLRRKNNQLEEFTQIVSHNLRAPVGNMVTLLNFLDGAVSNEEKTEYLKLLKESSETTLSMLNDLNEVLKIKQDKNVDRSALQFEEVLSHTRSMLNAKISRFSAEITYDFSEAPEILYPRIYMESVFLNLLDNALKYSHPERQPKIHFHTHTNRQGNILLEVQDNGLGINLQRYGQHVFKLRKTFHRHPESRGIGLFMIKNQIEAMGGEISISSKENEGSTFFINFNKIQVDES
jgi:PAS domain S-box-containing protein